MAQRNENTAPMRSIDRSVPIELEQRYTLNEAAEIFFKRRVTGRTLRREFVRHGLCVERIGGKDFCTESDICALLASSKRRLGHAAQEEAMACRAPESLPGSTQDVHGVTVEPPGSFSTERKRLALAQASMSVKRLKQPSKPTSLRPTGPQAAQISHINFSSRR
jgi:hypothetical protein